MKVFYAGDSPIGGAANYLLGVLHSIKAKVTHLPPSEKLKPLKLKSEFDVIILSDYSHKQVPAESEKILIEKIQQGSGFLMIGGWGSFSGPFGGWRGSQLEKIMPVQCASSDDRTNFPGGAAVCIKDKTSFLNPKMFQEAPAICGLNRILPRSSAKTLVSARQIVSDGTRICLAKQEYPLLIVDSHAKRRSAALATDLAPHWCGGLVDWGIKTLKLKVTPNIEIQVGNYYVEFIVSLLRWLSRS